MQGATPRPTDYAKLLAGARAPLRTLQEVVDQLGTAIAHFHVERFNLAGEEVVHPDCRNSHEKSDSRGHQSFRNATGHRAQPGRLLVRNAAERVDDTHHGSEQTHEGGGRTDRRKTADAALEFS